MKIALQEKDTNFKVAIFTKKKWNTYNGFKAYISSRSLEKGRFDTN